MIKVLLIGQVPPPYGGQAIMIKNIVDAKFEKVTIRHIPLTGNESMKGLGKFALGKAFYTLKVIFKAIYLLITDSIDILYYPPTGSGTFPVLRDTIILILVRPFAKRVVFHFHAGGISEYVTQKNIIIKLLARLAYNQPDAAIQLSSFCPPDADYVKAKKTFTIPYGINDQKNNYSLEIRNKKSVPVILFVGILIESKGIFVLLEALKILAEKNSPFVAWFMGEFAYSETEKRFLGLLEGYQLEDKVKLLGVLTGDEKWQAFADCNIFCFPTFFESEAFPIVLLEATMFELPVLATQWRGVQEIVDEEKTGYLIPIKNANACADYLHVLLENPGKREKMGFLGREKFLHNYTSAKFLDRIENAFVEIMQGSLDK